MCFFPQPPLQLQWIAELVSIVAKAHVALITDLDLLLKQCSAVHQLKLAVVCVVIRLALIAQLIALLLPMNSVTFIWTFTLAHVENQ